MIIDREKAAQYYNLDPQRPDDIGFYRDRIRSPESSILELGCGTGRVLIHLAENCAYIHGIDISPAMISLCIEELNESDIPASKVRVQAGDITNINLDKKITLIIAPYRVFQNLEKDEETEGIFSTIRKHLAPQGTCILNVFKPKRDPSKMRQEWVSQDENLCWESFLDGFRITCHVKNARIDLENLVLYPELIYRKYRDQELVDETTFKIVMRCYSPGEFKALITGHGFKILQQWGGYNGELYGKGNELVIEFQNSS